ncbi:hypothetical protein MBAV_004570 [Candidatus Magnetobacterium bavaricum]|uniref:Uncharacterized protein n=1 Tax=Candidatus Magnetobacterium bavaricum TaxID=29290 RepID=A0A0F3GMS8_9BACT|nr:hypothetical protein MBAV_004570 [Candidatus Magnetobacterium bavaricum]
MTCAIRSNRLPGITGFAVQGTVASALWPLHRVANRHIGLTKSSNTIVRIV